MCKIANNDERFHNRPSFQGLSVVHGSSHKSQMKTLHIFLECNLVLFHIVFAPIKVIHTFGGTTQYHHSGNSKQIKIFEQTFYINSFGKTCCPIINVESRSSSKNLFHICQSTDRADRGDLISPVLTRTQMVENTNQN